MRVRSLGWEDPLEKEMQPAPVFLPGESHGQQSLAGYSPRGCRELKHNGAANTHKRIGASQVVLVMKYLPASAGDRKRSLGFILGSGRSPGVGNGNTAPVLPAKVTWTEEPCGLQITGSQRVGHD